MSVERVVDGRVFRRLDFVHVWVSADGRAMLSGPPDSLAAAQRALEIDMVKVEPSEREESSR